ncbi:MAG: thioredoxin family protein [Verrucomicrobiae bacterium]|nr:thioredoxin family protein [Verrucomicrobiae bacterium]
MAEVPSTMTLKTGDRAPEFSLIDGAGALYCLDDVRGPNGLVIAFVCNHCPFVIHVAGQFASIASDYEERGIGFVAINPNDVANYPDDAPDKMVLFAQQYGWDFPYLYDESQEIAKAYSAACTPDFYVFDGELGLVYCGQLDDSRPKNDKPVTGNDLRDALDRMLAGDPPASKQKPSTGCNIKWKADNAPDYF